uniref:Galactosylgalactosylxylosylprotein 3-beta-glucuronosyltransferase n=1 Tax=Panagrolaimus superbus TaxID=310955 RepID=A0A914YKL9_9BILA
MALKFIREHCDEITNDDDNSYDTRLFNDYIRKVKKAGVWAVGLVGGAPLETPNVKDGKVIGWHVTWNKERKFAIDMAGFAISLDLIKNTEGHFGTECKMGAGAPETCFLDSLKLELKDLEPFGFTQDKKRELLVWHTQSVAVKYDKRKIDLHGFIIE